LFCIFSGYDLLGALDPTSSLSPHSGYKKTEDDSSEIRITTSHALMILINTTLSPPALAYVVGRETSCQMLHKSRKLPEAIRPITNSRLPNRSAQSLDPFQVLSFVIINKI
ncbi:hypothetical protein SDJN02_12809, partial [Cucurbita argyrosperma subsp. argyrosperma]